MCSPCECGEKEQSCKTQLEPVDFSPKVCRRCGAEPFVIIDKVRVECRQCFLEFCNKKFRTTIGKSKLVKNNACILVAYSGGQNSTALLDLINNSIRMETRREQKFRVAVIHVDTDTAKLKKPEESDSDYLNRRADELFRRLELLSTTYPGWPIYFTNIEQHFKIGGTAQNDCNQSSNALNYLKFDSHVNQGLIKALLDDHESWKNLEATLEEFSDLTDKQKHIDKSCSALIERVARQINLSIEHENDKFEYILTGSCATRLANDLLVDVVLGQGSSIGSSVSICDRRAYVPVMRPLREFNTKEIAFYLQAREILTNVFATPNLLTFQNRKASIQNVTEAFLSKLFLDYPSTYSTLLRTGSKMTE